MFCLCTSARFSDCMQAEGFRPESSGDVVLVLAETKRHKVANTAERKTTLLPLVGLGQWFAEVCWFSAWLGNMEAVLGKPASREFVLAVYSEKSGRWLNRAMEPAYIWSTEPHISPYEGGSPHSRYQ